MCAGLTSSCYERSPCFLLLLLCPQPRYLHCPLLCFFQAERIVQGSRPALDAMYLPLICPELGQQLSPGNSPPANDGLGQTPNSKNHSQHEGLAHTSSGEASSCSQKSLQRLAGGTSTSRQGSLGELAQVRALTQADSRAQGQPDVTWERQVTPDLQGELFRQLPSALLTRVSGTRSLNALDHIV